MADEHVEKTAQEPAPEVVVNVANDVLPQLSEKEKENEKEAPSPLPETEDHHDDPTTAATTTTTTTTTTTLETELSKSNDATDDKIPESASFKEETAKVADLPDLQRRALYDLKHLIKEALQNHEFSSSSSLPPSPKPEPKQATAADDKPTEAAPEDASTTAPPQEPAKPEPETTDDAEEKEKTASESPEQPQPESAEPALAEKAATDDDGAKTVEAIEETIVAVSSSVQQEQPPQPKELEENKATLSQAPGVETKDANDEALASQAPEEVSIWGIPLLGDERSDVVLLKFLRARDFKVKDAFVMLKNTIRWRKEFGIDELVDEDLGGNDLEKAVFMHGFDKEGHPVCYNVYGEFQNKELYQSTFSDEEKRQKFLRWRIQFLERSIRNLDFTPGGICTIVQVNDLKNSPGLGKWELRQATKQALQLLQDNYPEFVAKQVLLDSRFTLYICNL